MPCKASPSLVVSWLGASSWAGTSVHVHGLDVVYHGPLGSANASSFIAILYVFIILMGAFFLISVGVGVLVHTLHVAAFSSTSWRTAREQLPYVFDVPEASRVRMALSSAGQARASERYLSFYLYR